jgi:hypothetical protein
LGAFRLTIVCSEHEYTDVDTAYFKKRKKYKGVMIMRLIRKESREKLFFGKGILIHGHIVSYGEIYYRENLTLRHFFASQKIVLQTMARS